MRHVEGLTSCSAKTSSQLIWLDFRPTGLHSASMKILLLITGIQALNLVVFVWFNRTAGLRILVLRQQLAVFKRRSKKLAQKQGSHLLVSALKGLERLGLRVDPCETRDCDPMETEEVS